MTGLTEETRGGGPRPGQPASGALPGVLVALACCAVALAPLVAPSFFLPDPARPLPLRLAGACAALLVPAAAALLMWRRLPEIADRRARLRMLLLCGLLAALLTEVHRTSVDHGVYFGQRVDNTTLQRVLQEGVLERSPDLIPHSYRPLPNAFTRWLEFLGGDYPFARWIYRVTFGFLLLAWIYRFARLHVGHRPAVAAALLCCAVHPITIRFYAGQLNDPMSHLSFVLAFFALGTGAFPLFVLSLAIGALAKESVVALVAYYALFHRGEPAYGRRLAVASAASLVALAAPRIAVLRHAVDYTSVSGVGLGHALTNLADYGRWGPQLLFSVGLFVPFVLWGWRRADVALRRLTLFLLPVLLGSSLLFSWLREARNFVPLIVPMAIITAGLLLPRPTGERV